MKLLAATAISILALAPAIASSEEAPPSPIAVQWSVGTAKAPLATAKAAFIDDLQKANRTQPVAIPASKLSFKQVQSKGQFKANAGMEVLRSGDKRATRPWPPWGQQGKVKPGTEDQQHKVEYNNKE